MTRRKRPEAKSDRFPVATGLLRSAGSAIARHPSIAAGTAAFAVAFAFVSVNALVYQPGRHPAPLYNTRSIDGFEARPLALKDVPIPSSRVTTFRIEHSDPQSTASIPDRTETAVDVTVYNLQQAMRDNGFYDGTVDGVLGPRTMSAIRAYQQRVGLEPSGEPTDALLVHMLVSSLDAVAVPQPKPVVDQANAREKEPVTVADTEAEDPVADLIVNIQKGLSNIAYDDVKVDGVVGTQTSEAIADFQRHYRLPVTGQPDRLVLKKLREIGAL